MKLLRKNSLSGTIKREGLILSLLSLMLFSTSTLLTAQINRSNSDLSIIAKVTANILSTEQFRKHPLDDELSKQLFSEYFDMLDPGKIYFTKEDVKLFKPFETDLDDELLSGDISVAFKIYDLLIKRMEEYRDFANSAIDKGFDYKKDEDFLYDRKDAERPTRAEQKELWRKRLKYDLLALKLLDKAMASEKIEDKKEVEKRKVAKLWRKTPEQRLKKRIETLLLSLKKKREIDRLQFFLASLAQIYDPHSAYMAPKIAENFNIAMKNSLVGIGAVLTTDDGYTKIVSIIKGGPAERDGNLEAEDRIIAVAQGDEEPVDVVDMPLDDVVQLIRGKKDTIVKLHVMKGRNGGHSLPEIITIKRDKVELKDQDAQEEIYTVEVDGKKKKIGVIDLPSFYIDFKGAYERKPNYKSSTRDIKNILQKFTKEGIDGLIIDLRSNGGGSLQEAIQLTGLFIEKGPIVQVKGPGGKAPQVESDFDRKCYYSGPMIVLTSKFSASAAEIFAAAIQDYGRGIIIGDAHTHGKGTVQTILELNKILKHYGLKSNPGNLKITVAKFYRINGESTQMKGVEPDIIFPSLTDSRKLGEKYLDHALPWDTITPARYKHQDLTEITKKLSAKSKLRRSENQKFQERKKMIVMYKNILDRKKVSLNEATRWKEYQEDKKIFDKQDALLKKEKGDEDKKKKARENDITLQESIRIMQDWLKEEEQLQKNPKLADKK
jgi:carboxyl-terminal processing protease